MSLPCAAEKTEALNEGGQLIEHIENESNAPGQFEPALTLETVLEAFQSGKVKWHGTSLFYQCGLLLVTAMIVTLPLFYIALIGLAGYGIFWWGKNFAFLLGGQFHGVHLFMAKLMMGSPGTELEFAL